MTMQDYSTKMHSVHNRHLTKYLMTILFTPNGFTSQIRVLYFLSFIIQYK